MRISGSKFLLSLPLIILGLVFVLVVNGPATAAPPDTPPGQALAQGAGVTLEKRSNVEQVQLGQVVTYTITIQNNSSETINPTLTDTSPDPVNGLVFQDNSETASTGDVTANESNLTWQGQLAPGEEAVIEYAAVPPTSSAAGQTLENSAILQVGETTLRASATIQTLEPDLSFWRSFVNFIAKALVFFDQALQAISLPYAFGFAIILFTILVRAATFPLNMQQIKSSKAMQELQPKLKEIQEKHKGDREKLAQEQMRLYKEHGVNPLGGCLPMLVQMPIWFALYQSLIQLSQEGLLSEGFFWIPSLAGPVSTWGGGIEWLWPFPPSIGWANAIAYLVMPVLLVVSQLYMQQLMTPPSSDPQQAQMQSIMKFMPLMFGYFALIVPSGLTLYWFTSNILGVAQHYFTKSQLEQQPSTTKDEAKSEGAPVSSPVPAPTTVPATTSGENKKGKNVKSKRKSRRKR